MNMFRILFSLFVALGGTAAEVVLLPLAPADQEFVSDERKSAVPMPPGRGIVIVVAEELRWYGDDGARLHVGRTKSARQVRHTSRGLAYPSSQGALVLVDADGKETVVPDLDQLQLHTDTRDNLRAVSHVREQKRALQLLKSEPTWHLSEVEHPVMFEGDCYVLAEEPLTLVHIQTNRLDMHPPAIIYLVRDGNVVWRSEDGKWSFRGILPSGKLVLLSINQKASELAYLDMAGSLITVTLGSLPVVYVIADPNHQKGVIIVGEWQTKNGDWRAPGSTYRVQIYGEDGRVKHDFSRFDSFPVPVGFSYKVLFPSPAGSGRALVDPFSGEVLWSNKAKNFFLAPGEKTNADILVEQDGEVAWLFLFIGENPRLRIHPISDADASHHLVKGTGRWQFTGRDGSIWLYSKDSIYQIKL